MSTITPINIADLTEGIINGSGTFDKVMQSINAQLLEQYSSGRIDSGQYAEVYLGSVQSAISQSIQFLLGKDQAYLQAQLIEAQIAKTNVEAELVTVQKELAILGKDKVTAEIAQINQETEYNKSLQLNIEAELPKINAEAALARANADVAAKQVIVMDSTIAKSQKEVELLTAELSRQTLVKNKLTAENLVLDRQATKLNQENANLIAAKSKIESEVALLNQKKVTEVAQTQGGASGVVGAQIDLYAAQRQGFIDDAKVKRVKASNDVYAIGKSNDPDAVQDPTNMISTLESALTQLLS